MSYCLSSKFFHLMLHVSVFCSCWQWCRNTLNSNKICIDVTRFRIYKSGLVWSETKWRLSPHSALLPNLCNSSSRGHVCVSRVGRPFPDTTVEVNILQTHTVLSLLSNNRGIPFLLTFTISSKLILSSFPHHFCFLPHPLCMCCSLSPPLVENVQLSLVLQTENKGSVVAGGELNVCLDGMVVDLGSLPNGSTAADSESRLYHTHMHTHTHTHREVKEMTLNCTEKHL